MGTPKQESQFKLILIDVFLLVIHMNSEKIGQRDIFVFLLTLGITENDVEN